MIRMIHNSACVRRLRESHKIDLWLNLNDHSHIEDCYIFVSCIFDKSHEDEARNKIEELSKNNKVYVVGCFPDAFPSESFSNVKMHSLIGFDKFLDDCFNLNIPLTSLDDNIDHIIPISTGCIWDCAYCAIKHGVGRNLISTKLSKIDSLIDYFYSKNKTEPIRLTGEDTGLWGIDIQQPYSKLIDLLKTKDATYKFDNMTAEMFMNNFNDLMSLAAEKKITSIVVGLQHFNNYILSTMNRPKVDIDKFISCITQMTDNQADVTLYLMCNFPSETRDHFDEQINRIKILKKNWRIKFSIFDFHRKLNTNIPFEDIDIEIRKKRYHECCMAAMRND